MKTFIITFLMIFSIGTTSLVVAKEERNFDVDQYLFKIEILSTINKSIVDNWIKENEKYKDFHFVDKETLRSYRWMKSIWPTHSIKKTDGINPYGKIPMLKPTKQKPKRVINRRCDPFPCK